MASEQPLHYYDAKFNKILADFQDEQQRDQLKLSNGQPTLRGTQNTPHQMQRKLEQGENASMFQDIANSFLQENTKHLDAMKMKVDKLELKQAVKLGTIIVKNFQELLQRGITVGDKSGHQVGNRRQPNVQMRLPAFTTLQILKEIILPTYTLLSACYMMLGDMKMVSQTTSEVIRAQPNHFQCRMRRLQAWVRMQEWQKVQSQMDILRNMWPEKQWEFRMAVKNVEEEKERNNSNKKQDDKKITQMNENNHQQERNTEQQEDEYQVQPRKRPSKKLGSPIVTLIQCCKGFYSFCGKIKKFYYRNSMPITATSTIQRQRQELLDNSSTLK